METMRSIWELKSSLMGKQECEKIHKKNKVVVIKMHSLSTCIWKRDGKIIFALSLCTMNHLFDYLMKIWT